VQPKGFLMVVIVVTLPVLKRWNRTAVLPSAFGCAK
jgi:hypothetical protein